MHVRRLLITFVASAALASAAGPDARAIVAQSVANYEKDYHSALRYNYVQRDIDATDGSKKVTLSQVIVVQGLPFEKVISKNGQPLSAEEQRKEDEKYQKIMAERATPEARAKKIAEYEHAREFIREVPNAFQFTILGEEMVNGRANYVINCEPNPDYRPVDSKSKMFAHVTAKMWIDKQDLRWTRADAKVIAPISIGWVMAKIGEGAKISIRQERVASDVWLPSEISVNGNAKILMVKNHPIGEQILFSDYRPFASGEAQQTAAKLSTTVSH